MDTTIKIAEVFTDTPGGRYKNEGDFSGEEFREEFLIPALEKLEPSDSLLIDLDGAYGYPVSFLDEAFGGIARKFANDRKKRGLLDRISFRCNEERELIEEIKSLMNPGIAVSSGIK